MILINNKLVLLINSFSKAEIKQFRKFISSPFYSNGRNYIPILNDVLKFQSKKNSIPVNEKVRSGFVSGIKDLSEQTLRNRYSELFKLGEEFLIQKGLSEKKAEKDKLLMNKLLEKKLFTIFNIKYRDTMRQLKNEKFEPELSLYHSQFKFINVQYFQKKNKVEEVYKEYHDSSEIKLCFYLLSIFEYGLEFKQQEFDNRDYDHNYVNDFLKDLSVSAMMKKFRNSDSLIFKVTAMLYYMYKTFENTKNDKSFTEAKKIFSEVIDDLEDNYKTDLFSILINYCIYKFNEGDLNYRHELFRLYNEKLDQDLISDLQNKSYIFNHFRDYVFIGLSLKEYTWVKNFIKNYSAKLPIEIRESETKLTLAQLDFEKKKYNSSLKNLNEVKAAHYLQYIDTSVYKLCNYYELKNFEQALFEIEKLKQYARNHKEIPKSYYLPNIIFIKILGKLIKMKTDPGKPDNGLLLEEIKKHKAISKREWLLEKVDQLSS